ncbi:MAG TPA: hypothetical protein PLA92_02125 [Fimbriimonadaceae bacterium]|nr:hypothetical protein [Fimbriimonadaceae bacterium]
MLEVVTEACIRNHLDGDKNVLLKGRELCSLGFKTLPSAYGRERPLVAFNLIREMPFGARVAQERPQAPRKLLTLIEEAESLLNRFAGILVPFDLSSKGSCRDVVECSPLFFKQSQDALSLAPARKLIECGKFRSGKAVYLDRREVAVGVLFLGAEEGGSA